MFLAQERELLEAYIPGLDHFLTTQGLSRLEGRSSQELKSIIRDYGLASLWIPEQWGGKGIDPYVGIRIQRAIAACTPSMALMLTMHNFTVCFNSSLAAYVPCCAQLLCNASKSNLLIGSAFAEGRYGTGILDSTVYIEEHQEGYLISGSKKPCTMASSMDFITVGVAKKLEDGSKVTGMAILDINTPGVSQRHFWNIPLLAASDTNELHFDKAWVPKEQILLGDINDQEMTDIVAAGEVGGLCWFEIMACASYLGAVSNLAERVVSNPRIDAHERAKLGGELEFAQSALDGAIRLVTTESHDQALLARILMVRYSVQDIIGRCAMHAAEMVGGLAFIENNEISILLSACRCLAFHPISRKAAEPLLAQWLYGEH
jgi:alkylation response protein AidB-like acyl-CoA dehydrogenase